MHKIVAVVIGISLVLLGGGLTLFVVKEELVVKGEQNGSDEQKPHIFSERLPTDAEMQGLRQRFIHDIAFLSEYGDQRTVTEKNQITSFQQAWTNVNPTIAPFLGQRRSINDLFIYPSRNQGTVCVLQWIEVAHHTVELNLAIGTVVNGRVQTTDQQVLVLDQNYLGIASIKQSKPTIIALDPPLPLPTSIYFANSTPMLERFNRANCTADLPETAR
jgi:hypothetical protein